MIVQPNMMNTCLGLCCGAVLFEIVSFCVPAWIIVIYEKDYLSLRKSYAVWYIHECEAKTMTPLFREEVCSTEPYGERLPETIIKDYDYDHRYAYAFTRSQVLRWQIEVTLGIVCAFAASFMVFNLRRNNLKAMTDSGYSRQSEPSIIPFYAAAILITSSGVLYAAALLQLTSADITYVQHVNKEIPYGAVIGGVGAFFAFSSFVVFVFMFLRGCVGSQQTDANGIDQSGVEMPMVNS